MMPKRRSRNPSSKSSSQVKATDTKGLASNDTHKWGKFAIWAISIAVSVILCWLFWWPLWSGGGLIGGDLYPYYFPQKSLLDDSLHIGTIPLWNPFVGFGYPVLGESQTAALYPPNLLLFSQFEVNSAYNLSQLGHYLFAFLGMLCLGRRLGLGLPGALFASTIFIYGWFPSRICLEWAIIGGTWFVWILWSAIAFLQTGQRRYCGLTAVFLGLNLLAGHYNLAFITLLTLLPLPWLISWANSTVRAPEKDEVKPVKSGESGRFLSFLQWRPFALSIAIFLGFLLAGVQLLPTWELKSLSQRQTVNDAFAPTYGHLPVAAISQLWMPWSWYAGERTMDEQLATSNFLAVPMATNQAEAQLYIGMLPLLLVIVGLCIPRLRRDLRLRRPWAWLGLAVVSLIFATGWPTYWLSAVPGIGFFRGPGRYSITAAWVLSLISGATLDAALRWRNWTTARSGVVVALLLVITTGDLWAASRQYQFGTPPYFGRQVFYATLIDHPPITYLPESPLREFFKKAGPQSRLYAPGQNIPSLLGVSSIPVYLGLGPEIYESDAIRVDFSMSNADEIAAARKRLEHFGVTHLLLEQTIDEELWHARFLGARMDPFLNRALGRSEPFYLYAMKNSKGRAFLRGDDDSNKLVSMTVEPNDVRIEVQCVSDCQLILRDLWYPGWELKNENQHQTRYDEIFRSVELQAKDSREGNQTIQWVYRPASVKYGALVSLLGLIGLAGWLFIPPHRKLNT